jgi:hypothetical protein
MDEESVLEGRTLSPGGNYYYDTYQVGNEIVLKRLVPGNRRIRIPPLASPEAAKAEELTIGFVESDHLFVSGIHAGKRRAGLVDLRSHVALWTELEFSPTARPACPSRFQADVAPGRGLIYTGEPDSASPEYKVYGFDGDGGLLWSHKLSGDWIWGYPQWVVCARDGDIAALINGQAIGIIETKTGRLLDVQDILDPVEVPETGGFQAQSPLWWVWEASFIENRLTLVGQVGGGSNQPILIQVAVGPNGKITSLKEHPIMMRGLAPSALSCIVMPGEGDDAWIVAGFRK